MKKKIILLLTFLLILIIALFSCVSSPDLVAERPGSNSGSIIESPVQFQKVSLNKNEEKTRNAAVKVFTERGGHGSGTYFLYEGYHVIFTAAHVTAGGKNFLVVDRFGNKRLGYLAYSDSKIDFSIILIPAFEKIKPMKFRTPEYVPSQEIGKSLIFSGYPGRQTLRTVRGTVSGVEGRYFVMHSTAWSGSSGSGVFDSEGNFVGILFAITMSSDRGNPVLLESMIWVEPYNVIDWSVVSMVIKSLN